ncbi:response regulator [Patescibacteria group bacterium]|nr:response regulator [Patescibacteria group bacterium]
MKKILVVEDEKRLAEVLVDRLKEEGFLVAVAYDGQEALDKISKEKPDLILLDLVMPVLDGIGVLEELQSSLETKDIPVIVLTNLLSNEKVAQVLEAGGTHYLVKSDYTADDVVVAIKKRLGMV